MRPDLLRFLACPACGKSLHQTTSEGALETQDSELGCVSCGREWHVHGGTPDLTFPDDLQEQDERSRTLWNQIARLYDGINLFTGVLRGVSVRE